MGFLAQAILVVAGSKLDKSKLFLLITPRNLSQAHVVVCIVYYGSGTL